MSPQRVSLIGKTQTGLTMNIKGALNEHVTFAFMINYKEYLTVQCAFNAKTAMTITFMASNPAQLSCV
jgi:hypothetical protein